MKPRDLLFVVAAWYAPGSLSYAALWVFMIVLRLVQLGAVVILAASIFREVTP